MIAASRTVFECLSVDGSGRGCISPFRIAVIAAKGRHPKANEDESADRIPLHGRGFVAEMGEAASKNTWGM